MPTVALAAALAAATLAAPSPAPPPATGSAAIRAAVRAAAARQAPHARLDRVHVSCETPTAPTETTICGGYFRLHTGPLPARGRVIYYYLAAGSTVTPTPGRPGALTATLRTTTVPARSAAKRHLPARLTGTTTVAGPPAPAERTVHADLVLDGDDDYRHARLSRDRWVALAVPFFWTQAFDEGSVTVPGSVDHDFDLPPGGHCTIRVQTTATATAVPPQEQPDGGLVVRPKESGSGSARILTRTADPATSTITYTLATGALPTVVRVGPAPPGVAPRGYDTLVVTSAVEEELNRVGVPGPDGLPLLKSSHAQDAACDQDAAIAAQTFTQRAVATARVEPRTRPPHADPDDENPIPVAPKSYASP